MSQVAGLPKTYTTVPRRWSVPGAAERSRSTSPAIHLPPLLEGAGTHVCHAGGTVRTSRSIEVTSRSSPGGQVRTRTDFRARIRAFVAVGMALVLAAILGGSTVVAVEPRELLVADSFERPDAALWGATDDGLAWLHPTGRTAFSLDSGQGRMWVGGRGKARLTTLNTTVARVTMQFDFSLDRLTGGSGVQVMAVLRKSKAGSYHVRVRVGRQGRLWLSVAKARGNGAGRMIGKPALVRGWRYLAGQQVTVRAQAVKRDPTQLRIKVWPSGRHPSRQVAARP